MRTRRIAATATAAVLALSLAACDDGGDDADVMDEEMTDEEMTDEMEDEQG